MSSWNAGGAAGCHIYKVYEEGDGGGGRGVLMIEANSEDEKRRAGILDGMQFVRYIIAHTWEEAMTKHHEKMGWEPYEPFELE
jgi:hypothetical protein